MTRRIRLILISAALLALAAPVSAHAAVSAVIVDDTLAITGDGADDNIRLAVNEELAGSLDVFFGRFGRRFSRDQFSKIQIRAGGGNDHVEMDDVFDPFGHQEEITIEGEGGNDTLLGAGGPQMIRGGEGDDTLDGEGVRSNFGFAHNDSLQGGAGDDTFVWDGRDLSDNISGGTEADRVEIEGNNENETFRVGRTLAGITVQREPRSIRPPQDLVVRIAPGTETLDIDARDGFDEVTVSETITNEIAVDIDGGEKTDTITGGGGPDVITGGLGGDQIHGGGGDDRIAGNDGDDRLFGDAGTDTLDGGLGLDRFFCGTPGDKLIFEPGIDIVNESCLPLPVEPGPEPVAPGPGPQPDPGTGQPGAGEPGPGAGPPGGEPGAGQPALPVRGFGKPKVRASLRALTVTVRNVHTEVIVVRVGGTEKVGRRRFKHPNRAIVIAPGKTGKVTFNSSAKLRRALGRGRKVVRRPVITVADAGARETVRPRIAVKR